MGKSECDREEGGICNNQHVELGNPSSYMQCPSSTLNEQFLSSAELSQGAL